MLQLLGRGGMGDVYLATATGAAGFHKPVVVKVLRPKFVASPERTQRFVREAFIGAGLDHENLVQVFDLGEQDGQYFLAMEYVRGFSLGHVIAHAAAQRAPLPLDVVVHVTRLVASALEYVHRARDAQGRPLGLAHRDVSPSNVLLGVDGRVKLGDFGVAGLDSEDGERGDGAKGGLLAGKLPYLPPEAFRGERPAQAWDVYALGVTLYEALAARHAFPPGEPAQVAAAIEAGALPLAVARPGCPAALIEVVERAMNRDPAARFAAARDFAAALEAAFPRSLDDAERAREAFAATFALDSFREMAGPLPATGDAIATADLHPQLRTPEEIAAGATGEVVPLSPLRFGVSPALGASLARAGGERLAAYLGATLGRSIRTVVVGSYRDLVDWLAAGELDVAWMPPAAYLDAYDRGARALVVTRRRGRAHYQSALVVHEASRFRTLDDVRGETVAWVDRESAGGYLFAVAEVIRTLGQPSAVFKRQHFLGSHQAVCEAVANGWAAVGATYAVLDESGAIASSAWGDLLGPRAAELRPLCFTGTIPGDNIAHRPGLHDVTVDLLIDTLVDMSEDAQGRAILREVLNADGFDPADENAYATARPLIRLAQKAS